MNEAQAIQVALFRYGIISPLVTSSEKNDPKWRAEFFRNASLKKYEYPDGSLRSFSADTIRRYYKHYNEKGFDGLKPAPRSDVGISRTLDSDITEQVKYLLKEYPHLPCTVIYTKLKDNGTIINGHPSLSTLNRYVNRIKRNPDFSNSEAKEKHRYERENINEVWCADSSVGPYLKIDGVKHKTWIIGFIDDASRMIVGIGIFFNDNFINLMSVFRDAVLHYGKPRMLNLDNGSNYRCEQMTLLGARLGTALYYNPPRYPQGKSKIERYWYTQQTHWQAALNMNDFHSLKELEDSLLEYVQEYNLTVHSSLEGKSPKDRFFDQSHLIIRVPDEQIDKIFLLEIERRVSADCVIVIDKKEYEVEPKYARQKLLLRYSPDLSKIYSVDRRTGEMEEVRLLNKQVNSHLKRNKFRFSEGGSN